MRFSLKPLLLIAMAIGISVLLFKPVVTQADEFNLKTYITVSQPVQVPGAVLQPNVKYVFRRVGSNGDPDHVVRVMNADETKVISTFFAISDERLEPADGTILTFYETSSGFAKPVRSWFYPGRVIGYQFLYPKEQMAEITAHLHGEGPAQVLTAQNAETKPVVPQTSEESTSSSSEQVVVAPDSESVASSSESDLQREKPSEMTSQADTNLPSAEETAQAQTSEPDQPTPAELPRTAGELPLLGLIGLAALGLRLGFSRS